VDSDSTTDNAGFRRGILRPWLLIVCAVCAAVLATGAVLYHRFVWCPPVTEANWQRLWAGASQQGRYRIAEKLVERHWLEGMTRDNCLAALGPVHGGGAPSQQAGDGQGPLMYHLGFEQASRSDFLPPIRLLVVSFDESGKVSEVEIHSID
jgi:hypothetical protein